MKILLTSDLYIPTVNGVVTSVLNLKGGLEERGHEVRVLTLSKTVHSYKEGEVSYIGAMSAGAIYPGARVRPVISHPLITELIEWHPDIVHTNCELSTFTMARRIAKRCGVPLIHTYHTVYEDYTHYFIPSKRVGKAIVKKLSRIIANRTNGIIVPSVKVRRLLERYDVNAPLYVIPTGIDQSAFTASFDPAWKDEIKKKLEIPEDHVVLIYIGRLAKEKHADELIDGLARLKDKKATLLFVGDGPGRTHLEARAKSYDLLGNSMSLSGDIGIPGARTTDGGRLVSGENKSAYEAQVVFAGAVSPKEVGKYYHLGDIFVNASNSETQGLTYFEALSSGLPVLCKKDECLEGIVENGVNGWQFTTKDEFTEFLHEFATSKDKWEEMHKEALKTGERFSIASFASSVEGVYKEAIEDFKPPRRHGRRERIKVSTKAMARKIRRKTSRILKR